MTRLSRPQRNLLREAIAAGGLRNVSVHPRACVAQALHRKGMLQGIEHRPTEAGINVFKPKDSNNGR